MAKRERNKPRITCIYSTSTHEHLIRARHSSSAKRLMDGDQFTEMGETGIEASLG